jgi:hypothetical protein
MNVARQLRIFKVNYASNIEEAKDDELNYTDEQQLNVDINEIFSDTTELVRS